MIESEASDITDTLKKAKDLEKEGTFWQRATAGNVEDRHSFSPPSSSHPLAYIMPPKPSFRIPATRKYTSTPTDDDKLCLARKCGRKKASTDASGVKLQQLAHSPDPSCRNYTARNLLFDRLFCLSCDQNISCFPAMHPRFSDLVISNTAEGPYAA
jgi:hypothetical protein